MIERFTIAVFFGMLLAVGPVSACPVCVSALENGAGQDSSNLATGFYYSILFLLAVPFTLAGGLGSYLFILAKQGPHPESNTALDSSTEPPND